jgi:hypothetical protein
VGLSGITSFPAAYCSLGQHPDFEEIQGLFALAAEKGKFMGATSLQLCPDQREGEREKQRARDQKASKDFAPTIAPHSQVIAIKTQETLLVLEHKYINF